MINELFPFQKQAVGELIARTRIALDGYASAKFPQVVSLQAPTGSGKTIIMASFIEDIYQGSEVSEERPDAIFVWLSDSPQLNVQSRQKIEQKADRIGFNQCVMIEDESFDQEMLDDGFIYFLNTQKIGKAGNLGKHSDMRQYTIWETLENTAREKYDRLYFIIDEAHRGMQGREAGKATSIMQRFIKGSSEHGLSPMPLIIGMSATASRFNALVGDTTSTLQKVIITPAQVRASGLLKDRIIITYPDDPAKHSDMAVLQAATDEWINKCRHWYQYTYEQHYANVNPVFVIQVAAGKGDSLSDTDLDDVIAKIEEHMGDRFREGEVVHTFGSTGTVVINGLSVPHVEPSAIADNRKIRVVLFKENLSTGWDCPRAETMMSFRHAEDATYIAQLLGRMIRTPLQCHVEVDDSLNDVRLFLPYFNKGTVKKVIDELQSAEGGEIPAEIGGEALGSETYATWTVHTGGKKKYIQAQIPGQLSIADYIRGFRETSGDREECDDTCTNGEMPVAQDLDMSHVQPEPGISTKSVFPAGKPSFSADTLSEDQESETSVSVALINNREPVKTVHSDIQGSRLSAEERENVIRFINEQGYLTYQVRNVRVSSYLKSLLSLSGLLTQHAIYPDANKEISDNVTDLIHAYIDKLHREGKYDEYASRVLDIKLSVQVFDVFGEEIKDYPLSDFLYSSETDLDRQLRKADARLGGYGFPAKYGRRFVDLNNFNSYKNDCILFAGDDECMNQLNNYAEKKFHELNDKYRKNVVSKSEKCRKQYSDIVADGDEVSEHNFTLPATISVHVDGGGCAYYDHLFADEESGKAIIRLNGWERDVLEEERRRPDFVCWIRNAARQSWSLRIPYEIAGSIKEAFPDFIIVRKDPELEYVIDILEPHSPDFKDNLGKAKGFVRYAEKEPRIGRIELIRCAGKDTVGNNIYKRLDLARSAVRKKILDAINTDELDHIFETDGVVE